MLDKARLNLLIKTYTVVQQKHDKKANTAMLRALSQMARKEENEEILYILRHIQVK